MRLSDSNREIILNEIEIVREKMREEENPLKKLFYFSGIQSMTNRVLNLEFDSELLLVDLILAYCHRSIVTRFGAIAGGDQTVTLPENFLFLLEESLDELKHCIRNQESPIGFLQEIAKLTYVTTGNGYYLLSKGLLSLE